jgi:rsbT co-antagonist protein RsbR
MAEPERSFDRRRLHFTDHEIERRKAFVGLVAGDASAIATIRDLVVGDAEYFTAVFFDALERLPEAAPLFARRDRLETARQLKREHLVAMVGGEYGQAYVEQRIKLAMLYSEVGLDTRVFLGAFHQLVRAIGDAIMEKAGQNPPAAFDAFMSVNKICFFDIGIIVDVMIDEREHVISAQQDAIRELSTPVLQLRDRLLILPIIGVVDTQRANQLTDSLLHAIRANRARVVVMDITGVAAVDSKVANHLIQTVAAARLMGATVIITGISADVAQSLVALGVDLGTIRTVGDLQGGLEEAERLVGYRVVPLGEAAPRPPAT